MKCSYSRSFTIFVSGLKSAAVYSHLDLFLYEERSEVNSHQAAALNYKPQNRLEVRQEEVLLSVMFSVN